MTDQTATSINFLQKEVERDVSIQCYNILPKICSFQHKIETPKKTEKKKTQKSITHTQEKKAIETLQVLRVIVNKT